MIYKNSAIDPYTVKAYSLEHKKRYNIVIGKEKCIYGLQQVRKDFPLMLQQTKSWKKTTFTFYSKSVGTFHYCYSKPHHGTAPYECNRYENPCTKQQFRASRSQTAIAVYCCTVFGTPVASVFIL